MPRKETEDNTIKLCAGAGGKVSCARFRNDEFLIRTVEWPESLRAKVQKLNKVG